MYTVYSFLFICHDLLTDSFDMPENVKSIKRNFHETLTGMNVDCTDVGTIGGTNKATTRYQLSQNTKQAAGKRI
jgi:hypothetical protein